MSWALLVGSFGLFLANLYLLVWLNKKANRLMRFSHRCRRREWSSADRADSLEHELRLCREQRDEEAERKAVERRRYWDDLEIQNLGFEVQSLVKRHLRSSKCMDEGEKKAAGRVWPTTRPDDVPVKGRTYRHFKGTIYEVEDLILDAENDIRVVIYCNSDGIRFTRSLASWMQKVAPEDDGPYVPRFSPVTPDEGADHG